MGSVSTVPICHNTGERIVNEIHDETGFI
ncbi:hypothetical protein MNBD_CHLOROFLEXI01-4347, partial [hydrothermal vent metagenome]